MHRRRTMTDPGPERPSFFAELRGRGVLRVAASYGAIAWLLVQIAGTVAEPLELPRWALRATDFRSRAGFPGRDRPGLVPGTDPAGRSRGSAGRRASGGRAVVGLRRYADVAVIVLLLLVVGYLVARQPDVIGFTTGRPSPCCRSKTSARSPERQMLATGIAESVLHQLANLQQLDVISRTSSFTFKGRSQDAREIGRAAKGHVPARGQRAERSHAPAHHYATDRRPHRRRRLVDAVRPPIPRHFRRPGRDRIAGDARARIDAGRRLRSSA